MCYPINGTLSKGFITLVEYPVIIRELLIKT